MELIRQWAKETWTDHNAHDPGITLLEAFSYAMTELGLRLQLDIADLLRSGEARWTADLEPAHRVLPSGPVTAADLRRLLLDHPLVSDAQISLPADNEVSFYENLIGDPPRVGDPPLTYAPGTPRIRPSGLYEVVVEFRDDPDRELKLNSNIYSLEVSSGGLDYNVDLALPHWDEDEAAPFRRGAVINTIAMQVDGTEVWRPLSEPQSYFGKIRVDYTDPSGTTGTVLLWVLARITTVFEQPAAVVPGILAEVRTALESTAADRPLAHFVERIKNAVPAVRQLQRYLSGWRNLGEDAVRIGAARIQEIAVRARLEVTGGIDLEQLLARIFMDMNRMLSPQIRFQSLTEQRSGAGDAGRIYDGPLLRHGFLDADILRDIRLSVLYTSDLLRLIMRQRDGAGSDLVAQENPGGRAIIAVTDLAVSNFVNNRPITTEAGDCLYLVEIERYRPRLSLAKSRIIFVRNGAEVAYDLKRVESLFEGLQQQEQAGAFTANLSPVRPVPRGELLPVEDYTPLQNDLPSIYGVGEAALPDSASSQRLAAVNQLKGYLLLFEQFLADATAQLGNINRFFAADLEEYTTYFTRPLFELSGVAALLKQFPPGGDWSAFVADPGNPLTRALREAAENRELQLDRRNRMLDHRLARQGEDMVAFGQELHRWAQRELQADAIPLDQLPDRMAARREAANACLLRAKVALWRDTPELSAFRLLARSDPFWRNSGILRLDSSAVGYRWTLVLAGEDRLRSVDDFDSVTAAAVAAEDALLLAARDSFYTIVDIGTGRRRYQLRDGAEASARLLGESPRTFAGDVTAGAALVATAADFAELWLEASLTPMERRIAHLTGIRSQIRRRLLVPIAAHFEIFDAPVGGGLFSRRWRFWEFSGRTGQILLSSASNFEAATESEAIALAEESIRQVLRHGADEWNYMVSPPGPTNFGVELRDPAGQPLARRTPSADSRRKAEQRITETVDHLYRHYSAEGFHLIEHLALRPRRVGDAFLSPPTGVDARKEPDPYSQRLSLVFPSGYARDFSLPRDSAPTTPVTPHRFRDPEFRSHAEQMVQQSCPAHLLPTVYWVDRQTPGSVDSPASFDRFEKRYFAWLDTVLVPGAPPATVDTARAELVEALNAIANGP